jgi:hypothetical protein
MVSLHGVAPEGVRAIQDAFPMRPDDETISARAVKTRAVVHAADVLADRAYAQTRSQPVQVYSVPARK